MPLPDTLDPAPPRCPRLGRPSPASLPAAAPRSRGYAAAADGRPTGAHLHPSRCPVPRRSLAALAACSSTPSPSRRRRRRPHRRRVTAAPSIPPPWRRRRPRRAHPRRPSRPSRPARRSAAARTSRPRTASSRAPRARASPRSCSSPPATCSVDAYPGLRAARRERRRPRRRRCRRARPHRPRARRRRTRATSGSPTGAATEPAFPLALELSRRRGVAVTGGSFPEEGDLPPCNGDGRPDPRGDGLGGRRPSAPAVAVSRAGSGAGGTPGRGRGARPACRSGGSARGRRAAPRRRRAARRRPASDSLAERDAAARIRVEVARPVGLGRPGRDEQRAVRLLDVADGDLDRRGRVTRPRVSSRTTVPQPASCSPISSVSGAPRVGQRRAVSGPAARTCPRSATDGRVDQLDPCMSRERPRAERRHRLAERADEVLRAVADASPGRTGSSRASPTVPTLIRVPARQHRRRRGHAPVHAAARRLGGARQRRPEHQRVGAGRDRLGQLAAAAHPAVGDDRHVAAGLARGTRRARRRRRRSR